MSSRFNQVVKQRTGFINGDLMELAKVPRESDNVELEKVPVDQLPTLAGCGESVVKLVRLLYSSHSTI